MLHPTPTVRWLLERFWGFRRKQLTTRIDDCSILNTKQSGPLVLLAACNDYIVENSNARNCRRHTLCTACTAVRAACSSHGNDAFVVVFAFVHGAPRIFTKSRRVVTLVFRGRGRGGGGLHTNKAPRDCSSSRGLPLLFD